MDPTLLPEIAKTPTQLLIEARDPEGRDVRVIVKALYDEHRRLESVADALSALSGKNVTAATVHQWAIGWGWSFDRVLIIPAELAGAAA